MITAPVRWELRMGVWITMLFCVFFLFAAPARAINVPRFIGFQGQLTDANGDALTGTYSMTFRIYDSLTGGTALWTETQSSVSVSSGFFGVSLGNETALTLPFDTRYWVSVEVSSDGEMTPRQAIDSVATSYSSDVAYGTYVSSTAPTTSSGKLYYDSDDGNLYVYDHISGGWVDLTVTSSGSGAPTDASYLVTATSTDLSAEVLVSALGTNLTLSGDDTAARTITLGQTGAFDDLLVFDAGNISLTSAGALSVSSSINGTSLFLQDTAADNTLQLVFNEDAGANRILNLVLGDGSRNLTLNENFTIGGGTAGTLTYTTDTTLTVEAASTINQDLTTDANPTFAGATADALQLGVTATNELDTSAGNLILDSAGGTVQVDDILSVTGSSTLAALTAATTTLATTTITNTLSVTGAANFANLTNTTGTFNALYLQDTASDNTLQLVFNEDAGADRILNLVLGDGSRNLTLNENFTIGGGSAGTLTYTTGTTLTVEAASTINQDVTTDATPTFAAVTAGNIRIDNTGNQIDTTSGNLVLTSDASSQVQVTDDFAVLASNTFLATTTVTGTLAATGNITGSTLLLQDTAADNTLQLVFNEDAGANRVLNLVLGDGSRNLTLNENLTIGGGSAGTLTYTTGTTLTVEAASTVNQDLTTDANPTFAGVTAGNILIDSVANTIDTSSGDLQLSADTGTVRINDDILALGSVALATTTVTGTLTTTGNISGPNIIANTAIGFLDTGADNFVTINSGENNIGNRALVLNLGDGNRTLDIQGNAVINQDVDTAANVAFNTVALADTVANNTLQLVYSEDAAVNTILNIEMLDADRTLSLGQDFTVVNDSAATLWFQTGTTLTVEATSTLNQDLTTDANPSFNTISLADTLADNSLQFAWNENATGNYVLNFDLNDDNRNITLNDDLTIGGGGDGTLTFVGNQTLTVEATSTLNQDLTTDATVTFSTGTFDLALTASSGVYIGVSSTTNNLIDDGSNGAGSATLYIGNRTIDTTASDQRLKTNIQASEVDVFALFDQMNVVDFDWIEGDGQAGLGTMTGLIAQEVDTYLPQLVRKGANPEDYWSIQYTYMVPYTIKAIKEQQAQIAALSNTLLQNGAVAVDTTPAEGTVAVAEQLNYGSDTVGQARILAGQTEVRVTFDTPYAYQPIVVATPRRVIVGVSSYAVTDEDENGFTIKLSPAQTKEVDFNWHAFGANGGMLTVSNGQEFDIGLEIGPGSILPSPDDVEDEDVDEEQVEEEEGEEVASSTTSGIEDEIDTASSTPALEEETETPSSTPNNTEESPEEDDMQGGEANEDESESVVEDAETSDEQAEPEQEEDIVEEESPTTPASDEQQEELEPPPAPQPEPAVEEELEQEETT